VGVTEKEVYMATKQPAVYILASRLKGTLYTGVTSDLVRRVYEHRNNLADGFTKRYAVHSLVYYELHADMTEAIYREKQIKKWNRQWKVNLIEQGNPEWHDLWPEITGNEENGFPHTRE
jgi:putative endonuclease